MIKFSRSTNYPGSKVLYVLHYPLPYLKALKRKYISKIFQQNNQCNLPSKHLPADWFFKMVPPLLVNLITNPCIGKHRKDYTGIGLAEEEKGKETRRD